MLSINLGPFAVQLGHLFVLVALLVATGVGYLAGRRHKVGIGHVLLDMLLVAVLVARLAFVALWFDVYRAAPWSILDLRDGGFNVWGGLLAALLVAVWSAWRRPVLRQPMTWGLTAGALAWAAMSGAAGHFDTTKNQHLPKLALQTLAGEPADLAKVAGGKPMVVNLWASWCPPCRREMPILAAAQKQETELVFVFANQGEDAATAERYLSTDRLGLANVFLDMGTALGRAIGSTALPTTLFYDANGQLVATHLGELSAASLASKLKQLRTRANPSTQR